MSDYQPLTNPDTEGFPELVYAMHKALVDLLGDQFDIDYDALAPELADTAWRWAQAHLAEIDPLTAAWNAGLREAAQDRQGGDREPRCTCAESNATGATSWGYLCNACMGDDESPCTPESPSCEAHRSGRSWLLPCPQHVGHEQTTDAADGEVAW